MHQSEVFNIWWGSSGIWTPIHTNILILYHRRYFSVIFTWNVYNLFVRLWSEYVYVCQAGILIPDDVYSLCCNQEAIPAKYLSAYMLSCSHCCFICRRASKKQATYDIVIFFRFIYWVIVQAVLFNGFYTRKTPKQSNILLLCRA